MKPLAAIHVARKQLGLEEDDYRAVLSRVTGKRSSKGMSEAERAAVLDEFRRLGFKPVSKARSKGLQGPYAKKLQALWIAAWNLGIVRDRRDEAMISFVKRQTGLDHMRFLIDAADAKKAIEALKIWIGREGDVGFGCSTGYEFLKTDPGRIAWAQWRMLHPEAELPDHWPFDSEVESIIGRSVVHFGSLTPADWRAVMNELGTRIRARKGRG